MAWVTVTRQSPSLDAGILVSVVRQRLRNGRTLHLMRIRLDTDVMRRAGLVLGAWVEVMRGEGEDAGKIGLRRSDDQRTAFRVARHSGRQDACGQIAFDAMILGIPIPISVAAIRVDYRVGADFIEIFLPKDLRARPRRSEIDTETGLSDSARAHPPSNPPTGTGPPETSMIRTFPRLVPPSAR